LAPMLLRYRRAAGGAAQTRLGLLTAIVGVAYFHVWAILGIIAFPFGAVLAALTMRLPALARAVPIAVGMVLLIAGALQFTAWKRHRLRCCLAAPESHRIRPLDARTAWRHGVRLGMHCVHCCAGLTAVLLVMGVMDLRAMAAATAGISAERLLPAGERVARAIGTVLVVAGLLLIAQAVSRGHA
jgi:predicted metal-binding membrane protein